MINKYINEVTKFQEHLDNAKNLKKKIKNKNKKSKYKLSKIENRKPKIKNQNREQDQKCVRVCTCDTLRRERNVRFT